jgi:prolycopene isomerase
MNGSLNISSDRYDIIVIGSGMGGLTAAALLAKEGRKVLVVEQEEQPGGHARTFTHGPYTYDRALHLIMGCAESSPLGIGIIDALLRHLRVRDRCEFLRVDPLLTAHFPDYRIRLPGTMAGYKQALIKEFPSEAKGIERLTDLYAEIYKELLAFPILPGLTGWLRALVKQPKLFRYANATLNSVLDAHLSDPRLKAICASLKPYVGLTPSRVSFLLWAAMMASYLEEGAFICRGGFQNLANAVASSLAENGGELVLKRRVARIQVRGGKAGGVELDNGQVAAAPIVISNMDAGQTFEEFVPESERPSRYLRKLKGMTLSPLVAKLYLGTDLDVSSLGVTHVNALYTSWNIEDTDWISMKNRVPCFVVVPTVSNDSLAPPDRHVVTIETFVAGDVFSTDTVLSPDSAVYKRLLEGGETILPGLGGHITDVGGSAIMGPIYGWEAVPKQSGVFRPGHITPISGLYLCGHWTQPGHGIWTVVMSGIRTARIILNRGPSRGMEDLGL